MRTMNCLRWSVLALPLLLCACQSVGGKDTIATLRTMQIEIKEEKIEGGLEKAMEGYRRFLEETPDAALKPEAIRRLADLKVEREYGVLSGDTAAERRGSAATLPSPERAARPEVAPLRSSVPAPAPGEAQADFEKRAAQSTATGTAAAADGLAEGADDLKRAGALEAIELYKKLLNDYPAYERNDQVLYQMSRAYEELGQVDEAMGVMNRLVRDYPKSRYMDEVQFRRAEYFFTRRHYLDAEEAYGSIVAMGVSSSYYQLALYKLGWTFYKQELYDEALHRFIALLDYKVSMGYDFAQTKDEQERKRIDDTFRVISLSFSNLGGANSVVEYFNRHGKRSYEDGVYSNLGEFYFDKRRYADAAATYNAFVSRNPFHKVSPQFAMRVIEIHLAGAFPSLVIDAKKQFARNYGLKAEYWQHFEPAPVRKFWPGSKRTLLIWPNIIMRFTRVRSRSRTRRQTSRKRCIGTGNSSPPSRWTPSRRLLIICWRICSWKTAPLIWRRWNTRRPPMNTRVTKSPRRPATQQFTPIANILPALRPRQKIR